jgi:hypothetical protein
MTDFPRQRHRTRTTPRRTAGSRLVRIYVSFSGRYPCAQRDVEARLAPLADGAGINAWLTGRRLTLVRGGRAITPAEWSAIVGWLLCQPEVVYVAREYPVGPDPRRHHAAAR